MEKREKSGKSSDLFSNIVTVPNILTMTRIILSLGIMKHIFVSGLSPMTMFGITSPFVLPVFASLVVLTDTLDGLIARKFNCSSELGGALDAIADKVFNWGIALSVVVSKVMPLSSLLLLTPTLIRDVYVAIRSAKDKIEDGKKNIKEDKTKQEKEESLHNGLSKTLLYLRNGKGLPPTMVAKVKMWGMSISVISGLCFGFSLISNPIFLVSGIVTDALSIIDIPLFNKKMKEKKKLREESLVAESNIEKKEETKSQEKTFQKETKKVRSEEEIRMVDHYLEQLEKSSNNQENMRNDCGKVLIKK